MAQMMMVVTPGGDYIVMVKDVPAMRKSLVAGSDLIPITEASALRLHTIYGADPLQQMFKEFNEEGA